MIDFFVDRGKTKAFMERRPQVNKFTYTRWIPDFMQSKRASCRVLERWIIDKIMWARDFFSNLGRILLRLT